MAAPVGPLWAYVENIATASAELHRFGWCGLCVAPGAFGLIAMMWVCEYEPGGRALVGPAEGAVPRYATGPGDGAAGRED